MSFVTAHEQVAETMTLQRQFPAFDISLSLLGIPFNPKASIKET